MNGPMVCVMTTAAFLSLFCANAPAQLTPQIGLDPLAEAAAGGDLAGVDSAQMDLVPLAEFYGAGFIIRTLDFTGDSTTTRWQKVGGEATLQYGANGIRGLNLSSYRAWAIYDVSGLPDSIEVQELTLTSYIWRAVGEFGITSYGRMTMDPRAHEPEALWDAFESQYGGGPPIEGTDLVVTLSEQAFTDLEQAVQGSDIFPVAITRYDLTYSGLTVVHGWWEALPRLTVTYEDSTVTPVMPTTWGRIKGHYGH